MNVGFPGHNLLLNEISVKHAETYISPMLPRVTLLACLAVMRKDSTQAEIINQVLSLIINHYSSFCWSTMFTCNK